MKKNRYILIPILLITFAFTSCFEDKSSEIYEPFGKITIEGIEESYSLISFSDVLSINPEISSTDSNDTFEYLWMIFNNSKFHHIGGYTQVDTITHEKSLNFPINISPGSYTVTLCVTNTKNNYTEYARTVLTVGTIFSTGYFILKETAEDNTDVDFHNQEGELYTNILEKFTDNPLRGKPNKLSIIADYSFIDEETTEFKRGSILFPTSSQDSKIILIDDLSLIYDHQTMFYGDEPVETPHLLFNTLFNPIYISNKGSYLTKQSSIQDGSGKFGFPAVPVENCVYNENLIVVPEFYGFTSVATMFDDYNGDFVQIDYRNTPITLTDDEEHEYSAFGIKHKLLYMGTSSTSNGSGWAIFQDKDNPNIRYLYTLKNDTKNSVSNIDTIAPSLNFSKTNVYGSNKRDQRIYCAINNKLYMYDPASRTEMDITPTEIESDEEITLITHKNGEDTYLIIGTFKNGNYKVYMYTIAAGAPYGSPKVIIEGSGKVIDIQHTSTSGLYINR